MAPRRRPERPRHPQAGAGQIARALPGGGHGGNFEGIVLPGPASSGLSAAEKGALAWYERTFRASPGIQSTWGIDVDTVAAEINEFNWHNTSKADGGSGICQGSKVTACLKPVNPQTWWASRILSGQVQIVLNALMDNDPRPFFMHQSNRTGDRLAYQVMDGILSAYRSIYGADTRSSTCRCRGTRMS